MNPEMTIGSLRDEIYLDLKGNYEQVQKDKKISGNLPVISGHVSTSTRKVISSNINRLVKLMDNGIING